MCLPWPHDEVAARAARRSRFEVQGRARHSIRHRDEVEAPITDWLQEAYDYSGAVATAGAAARVTKKTKTARKSVKTKAKTSKRR